MKIHKIIVGELATNCYIVSSEKGNAFVIDPGDETARIKDFLSRHNLIAQFIVDTHGHIDHIKANADLGLPVYVHEDDADMISRPEKNLMTTFFGKFKPVVPERLLGDGDVVSLDGLAFKVIHTPGHTRGSICLYGEGILFSGDTLFKDGVGRTDFPGSSHALLEGSLKKISALGRDIIVYPGHGPQTSVGRELH